MYNEIEILLVEDSRSDAEMTIDALNQHNLANKLLHVKDGVEALKFLFSKEKYSGRNTDNKLRLVLLDLKMPKMGGIEVLKAIRDDPRTKMTPVVILTSSNEDPDIKISYNLGVNSYVVKPLDFDQFYKAISNLGFYWMIVNNPVM